MKKKALVNMNTSTQLPHLLPEIVSEHFTTLSSTQRYMRERVQEISGWRCVSTHNQTSGIGQYERKWISPKNVSITFTLGFSFPLEQNQLIQQHITQVTALAIVDVLEQFGLNPKIKWINDIFINDKKLGGILCETVRKNAHEGVCLTGVGMNVNTPLSVLSEIDQPSTSLLLESGKKWNCDALQTRFVSAIQSKTVQLMKEGFSIFYNDLTNKILHQGKAVRIRVDQSTFIDGILEGITQDGALILRTQDNKTKHFFSGRLELI